MRGLKYFTKICCICLTVFVLNTASSSVIRLAGGSRHNEGRVEIFYNGTWGTICDDGWIQEDVNVVCAELGFKRTGGLSNPSRAYFGQGTGLIWLSNVRCSGSESSIFNCTHSDWGDTSFCDHREDIGIVCQPIVRLVDGYGRYDGRVEIFHDDTWAPVCGKDFGHSEADVVCRHLGFEESKDTVEHNTYQASKNETLWQTDLECNGTESSLVQCKSGDVWHSVTECNTTVSITCYEKPSVRLVEGFKPYEGRVEYLYNGTWGTICDFNDWDGLDATVVCNQLGYLPIGAEAKSEAYFGSGSDEIWFSDVQCVGTEPSLADCHHSGWTNPKCDHTEDVSVICKPVLRLLDGRTHNEGFVQIWYNNTWTEVCPENFRNQEEQVVCRHLGFNTTGIRRLLRNNTGISNEMTLSRTFNCTGLESSLHACHQYSESECFSDNPVYLICPPDPATVRLVDGTRPYEGRVEVWYNGVWGTVCDDYWDKEDAAVVCSQLGFRPEEAEIREFAHFGEGSGPVMLNRVDCVGSEATLQECTVDGWGKDGTCDHREDASVICHPSTRLSGSSSMHEGLVEMWYNSTWVGVCADNWERQAAQVVCGHLGYNESTAMVSLASKFDVSTLTDWLELSHLNCTGMEANLVDCQYGRVAPSDSCSNLASVICTPLPPVIRLAVGAQPYEGRVEVYYNNTWGTVCGDFVWDDNDAQVTCRQLGLPSSEAAVKANDAYGVGTGPIWLSNMRCSGSEHTLADCSHDGWKNQPCTHKDDAAVICPVPVRLTGGRGTHEGRVEVYYRGVWTSVCDNGWGQNEASVTCEFLGFNSSTSQVKKTSHFKSSNISKWLSGVQCSGSEASLMDCLGDGWSEATTCEHAAFLVCIDVPVEIRLVNGNTNNEGRLEYFHNGEWGTVCGDQFDQLDASVACRQLGFNPNGADFKPDAHFGPGSGKIWLDNVDCEGSESYLADCIHNNWGDHNCRHEEDVSVVCPAPVPVSNVSLTDKVLHFLDGQSTWITCQTTESFPSASITWYINDVITNETSSSITNGSTTSILQYTSSSTTPRVTIVCSASNGVGEPVNDSLSVNITHGPDEIIFSPSSVEYVLEGDDVAPIVCSAANCYPDCQVLWYYTTDQGIVQVDSVDGILNISNINRSQAGTYVCEVSNTRIYKSLQSSFNITVKYGPASVSLSPPDDDISKSEGDAVQVVCEADCVPDCQFKWFKQLPNSMKLLTETKTLNLVNIQATDYGDYICQVDNPLIIMDKPLTANVSLTVLHAPVVDPESQTKRRIVTSTGKTVRLTITVIGQSHNFTWYKLSSSDDQEIPLLDTRITQRDSTSSSTLTIEDVKMSDYGKYVVHVSNKQGMLSMVYEVAPPSETSDTDPSELGLGVGIGIGILIATIVFVIIIIIICLVYKRRGYIINGRGFSNGVSQYVMTDKY